MHNLYFKLTTEEDNANRDLVYMRSMITMTSINEEGKEVFGMYDKDKYISVDDYFKKAEYIGAFAVRNKPVMFGKLPDISYTEPCTYALLYASDELGIGYDLETDSYEIITREYMEDYKNNWVIGGKVTTITKEPTIIVKQLLTTEVLKNDNKKIFKKVK